MTNGRAFYLVMRLTSILVLMVDIWVQRPQDTAYQSQFVPQGQSNFPPKIGIWGCFTRQAVGALRIFDDNMDTRLVY